MFQHLKLLQTDVTFRVIYENVIDTMEKEKNDIFH